MNNLKEEIKKTLWMKLPPKVIFPDNCTTVEQRLQYLRVHEAGHHTLPTGSPYSRAIHECQYKFIFRELYFHTYKEDPPIRPGHSKRHPTQAILKRLVSQKLNRNRHSRMLLQMTHRNMARIVINQFYNVGHFAWWSVIYQANNEIDRDILADLLWGAIGPPRMNPEWKTSTVISLLRSIRESEDFSVMPMLSDALQDAGCEDNNLTTRLREASHFSLGDWLFKATGLIG